MSEIERLQKIADDIPPPDKLKKMSADELVALLDTPAYAFGNMREQLHHVINQRLLTDIKNKKEHWSLTWVFWVGVVTMIAAIIAAVPVVQDWLSPKPAPAKLESPVPNTSSKFPQPLPPSPAKSPEAGKK